MKLPKSWKEITIEQYEQLCLLPALNLNTIEEQIRRIAILTGNYEEAKSLPYPQGLKEANDQLSWLGNTDGLVFFNEFTINGETFYVNPGINHMSGGQVLDFLELIKDKDKINYNLHKIMAVMCLRKGEKYDVIGHEQRAELFYKHLTMDVILPVSAFFLTLYLDFLKAIPGSLVQMTSQYLKEEGISLVKSGVGSPS